MARISKRQYGAETVWMGALLMLVLLIFVRMIISGAVCKIMMV